jgi:hypothetical protein
VRNQTTSEAALRRRAYELWKARGARHGHDQDDWYAAEMAIALEEKLDRKLEPPEFRTVQPAEILRQVEISHAGIHDFFCPAHSWMETRADLETIFEFDGNRRLHFNEGFLAASRRVALDLTITAIDETSHFPYRDLPAVREKIGALIARYRRGETPPPPLFFYPASGELEILDGVHRTIAAYEAARRFGSPGALTIWVGFNSNLFDPGLVVQQLWCSSLRRCCPAAAGR